LQPGKDFQVDPIYKVEKMSVQLNEIRGKCLENPDYIYHNSAYKNLLQSVVPLRKEFRLTQDISARKQIAKLEYDSWNQYLQQRKFDITQLKL
jgi:hypothetical protein